MTNIFSDQRSFMHLAGQSTEYRNLDQARLYLRLTEEEFHELKEAVELSDGVNAIKEACDILVVTTGFLHSLGIDVEKAWSIVHQGNMDKVTGESVEKRADGKVIKSPEWKAQHKREIHQKLEELVANGN